MGGETGKKGRGRKGKEGEELSSSSFKKYFPFVHFQNLANNIYSFFHLLLFTPSTFSIKALLRYNLYTIKFTIERWMGLWDFFSDLCIIFGCAGPCRCAGFSLAAVRRATPSLRGGGFSGLSTGSRVLGLQGLWLLARQLQVPGSRAQVR